MRKPFSLHRRPLTKAGRYMYYCQFWNAELGRYETARSSGCTTKAAAEAWAYAQLSNPYANKKTPQVQ